MRTWPVFAEPVTYDGSFKVLTRSDKHFTLQFLNRTDVISIDQLKPAHIGISTPENPLQYMTHPLKQLHHQQQQQHELLIQAVMSTGQSILQHNTFTGGSIVA